MIKKAILGVALSTLLFSCDENNVLESTGTADFSVTGLPVLTTNYTYQTWLLVGGSYVSVGTFNMDNSGNPTETEFTDINNLDLANATGVAITVEFTGTGSKYSPSDLVILAGDFSDDTATLLTTDIRTIYASDLKADYIVDAPTALKAEKSDTGQNGIWFSTVYDQTEETAGLVLPYNQNDENKATSNLLYQGWLYAPSTEDDEDDIPLNMGTFTVADSPDNSNSYKGTNSDFTPVLPGNDFISVSGKNVDSPIEVLEKRIIITVKPNEETTADSEPFSFVLFDTTITEEKGSLDVYQNDYSATLIKNQ